MFKAMIMLYRRDDMTADEFRTWWLDEHAPLAALLPGAKRVHFNVVTDGGDDVPDGVSELWFDSRQEFEAAYATDVGRRVAADSLSHVRARTRLFVEERSIV